MSKRFTRFICALLSLFMLLGAMPLQIMAQEMGKDAARPHVEYPTADYNGLILEFSSAGSLEVFRAIYGGSVLGGNMLLVDGTYTDAVRYEKMTHIESVTYNYLVTTDSFEEEYGIAPSERNNAGDREFWRHVGKLADEAGLDGLYTVRVGVLDTGIDATHEDLKNRTVAGYDAISDTVIAKGVNSDLGRDGHGTQVAGLIGAETNNGVGLAGAAGLFPVELVPIRVLDENGKGRISDVVRGIYWAIENKVDILNMSFGAKMEIYPTALANAIRDAVNQNMFPICAGGNDSGNTSETYDGYYPADLPGAYPVLSGYGRYPDSFSHSKKYSDEPGIDYTSIDGENIYTTQKGGGYGGFTGTSASCARISGTSAAMFAILGGRTNPKSAELVRRVYEELHYEGTELHMYHIRLYGRSWGYKTDDDIVDAIKSARITIQGLLECRSVISGLAEITAQISLGKELVGDAALVVYDEDGNVIHTSEPVANDGTNPTEYKFTLDTSSLGDGAVTLKVFYRTAAQVEAGTDCKTVINFSQSTVYIRNSLMVTSMQIFLYDKDGNEFSAPVTVTDPATGSVITTLGSKYYSGIIVDRKLFDSNGGTLKFTYAGEGMVCSMTTTFVPEIEMGGDHAQETVLRFSSDDVTLAGATVYAKVGNDYCGVGTTDTDGSLTVLLSDGTHTLAVKDTANKYLLHMEATQNGSLTEISFAEDIRAARAFNIRAATRLGTGDYYSVAVSTGNFTSTTDGITLGWLEPEENTVYLSPIKQNMAVNVYDYICVSELADQDRYQKYYFTSHIIGEVDVRTESGVDFDPASLKTFFRLDRNSLNYGDSTSFELNVRDDKGYVVFGGCLMNYSDKMTVPYYTDWPGGNIVKSVKSSAGTEIIEDEWSEIINMYEKRLRTSFYGQMLFPAVSDDYTVSLMLSFNTELADGSYTYAGYLPYSFGTGTAALHVDAGKMIRLNPILPEGADYTGCDVENIYTWKNGKAERLTVFENYGEDGKEVYIDASDLEAGMPVFIPVHVDYYPEGADDDHLLYPAYFEYDPEKLTVDLTKPDVKFGNFKTTIGGWEKNGTTVEFNINGMIFPVDKTDSYRIPAGDYYIHAVDHYNEAMYIYRMKLKADENNTETVIDGTGMKKITVSVDEKAISVQLIPLMAGMMVGENEISGIGMLYNTKTLYIDDSVEHLFADVKDCGSDDVGRMSYRVEIPTDSDSITINGNGIDSFSAAPSQSEYTTEQDVIIDLFATMVGNFRLFGLSYMKPYDPKLGIEGEIVPYYPVIKYRKVGGEWQTKSFADWNSVSLGKLGVGEYEAVVSFSGVSAHNIPARETGMMHFSVTAAANTNFVRLFAPVAASDDVIITVSGIAGATVTVSYTTPSGATKVLVPVTLPESGNFRLSIPLTETGEYTFSAVSKKSGENDAVAEIVKVRSVASVVAAVTGLTVTNDGSGRLKLTWNKHGADIRIWIYRDGESLGYVSSLETTYTDTGLDSARIYTYKLVAEDAAGNRSEPISASGRPTEVADTQKPTTPVSLTAQVSGTSVTLKWTRSDDNVRVAGYRIYRDGKLIKDTTKRTFVDAGLARGTGYTYYVKAYDGAGNESDASMSVNITTASDQWINRMTVTLDRNKFGAITGDVITIQVSAASDTDRAIAEIVYTTLDEPTVEKKQTVELGKAGVIWNGTWRFSRIYEIKSVTAITYMGGEESARKSSDEFPCMISSSIAIPVTVRNAVFAKNALKRMSVLLESENTGTVYSLPILPDSETELYTFANISAGTYTLTVKYNGETLYYVGNIELLGGVNKVLEGFETTSFVRFKIPYQSLIYKPTSGNEYGYRINDSGYLEDSFGDSAFYMYNPYNKPSFEYKFARTVGEWYSEGKDAIYVLPENLAITITQGVTEYALPVLSTFEEAESVPVRIKLTSKSGISLAGAVVRLNRDSMTSEARLDENGEVEIAFPVTSKAYLAVLDIELYDESGNRIAKIPQQTFDFPITAPGTTFTQDIYVITGTENVKLKFTSDVPLDGITGILSGRGDNIKFRLDASGEATLPMLPTYTGGYSVTIYTSVVEGYFVKQQTFSFSGTEYTAEIKAQKAKTHKINLRFTDPEGYSVEGATVRISSDFATSVFTLGADGRISANIATSVSNNIRIEVSGTRGNIRWENNTFKAKADTEAEQTFEMNSYLKVTAALTKKGNYGYYLFYRDGGELKSVSGYRMASVTEIPSIAANGGELFIIPRGSMKSFYISGTVEEQYALIKSLDCIPKINLTRQNVEQVLKINTSDIEYYTVTEVKDVIGTKIDYIEVYIFIDGKLFWSSDYSKEATMIPKLKNGQQVIIRQTTSADINEYLPYIGKYCAEWIIDDIAPHEKNFTLGYQSRYTFKFTDSDGNVRNELPITSYAFITSSRERYSALYDCSDGTFALYIRDPLAKALTVFATWQAGVNNEFNWMYSFWDSRASFKYEIDDITVAKPGIITLSAEYKPVYRISNWYGNLVNNIKSMKLQRDGSYYIRMTQSGASDYESIIELPQGAYDITLDGEEQTSREIALGKGTIKSHNITFRISQEDLEKNYNINAYIITPEGDRSLQFIYELEHEIFSYYLQREISSEEVLFMSPSHRSGIRAYHVDVYTLEPVNGAHWGLYRSLLAQTTKGFKFKEGDFLNPSSAYYDETYSMDDYRSDPYLFYYKGFKTPIEGKWLTFKTPSDNFAVSLKVNGVPVDYSFHENSMVFTSSFGRGNSPTKWTSKISSVGTSVSLSKNLSSIDSENNRIWNSAGSLQLYGMYNDSTEYGYLYIPLSRPDVSPCVYNIEVGFRYRDADGNIVTNIYEDSITMYTDAPVLEKWNFEHCDHTLTKYPTQYVNIRSRKDRIAYENSENGNYSFAWGCTGLFTFNAWFDKPYEVCNVYAVADVPDYCENRFIKLEYDEELGYYTGTGPLGDDITPPKNYNIVFDYVAAQPYKNMPTVQLTDIAYTFSKTAQDGFEVTGLPEGWTYELVAPENGWTLAETYAAWEKYAALISSGVTVTMEKLTPIFDKNLRLYVPAYAVYDEKGNYVATRERYYAINDKSSFDGSYSLAVMNGAEYIGTLKNSYSRDSENCRVTFATVASDPSLILPDVMADTVHSAGIGEFIEGNNIGVKNFNSDLGNNIVGAYDQVSTAVGYYDKLNRLADLANDGWTRDLPADIRQNYYDYEKGNSLGNAAMAIAGVPGGIIGGIAAMPYEAWRGKKQNEIKEKYQKMAEINRKMQKEQADMDFFRQFGYRPDDDCFPDSPNLSRPEYYIDPSGYIFEGIESNRLDGVTATVYYLDPASGEWVKWDSEAYGEGPNPNISGTDGKYGWDVLIGKWKVVFEKDGYYTVESIELDVPPAHLDVNMSMVSTSAAKLKEAKAGAGGVYIDFTFDKPVLTEDVKRCITVMFAGEALDGTIIALDEAQTKFGNKQKHGENDLTEGLIVATRFRFTPDDPIEIGASVTVKGEQGIMTYNGIEMAEFESKYVLIPATIADLITALSYSDMEELDIGATLDLKVKLQKTGTEGTITFKALNPAVATVSEDGIVTAVSGGKAYIQISCGEVKTVAAISVNAAPHTHSFDRKLAIDDYKASDATCTAAAEYYFLCSCGMISTETYRYGDPLGHSYGEWEVNLSTGKCERTCSLCGEREERTDISMLRVVSDYTKADGTVRVDIFLENNPGIATLLLKLTYPTGAVTLEDAINGGLFSGLISNPAEGVFRFENAGNVTGSGLLLTLVFKVKEGAEPGDYRFGAEVDSCRDAALEVVSVVAGCCDVSIERKAIRGDVNGDGIVDATDLDILRKYLVSDSKNLLDGADMNGDGKIDTVDLTLLRKKIAGGTAGE